MKKKIVSLLLAMALVLAYAIPVAATETEQPSTEPAPAELTEPLEKSVYENEIIPKTSGEAVSSDPEIQKAYDEFIALETAFNNRDYAALESAYSTMENNNDSEDWTEAQDEEFTEIITNTVGLNHYLEVVFDSAGIIVTEELHQDFLSKKDAASAYEFVDQYDTLKTDYELDFFEFVPAAEVDYNDALTNYLPSDDAKVVYDAYYDLAYVLELGYYDEDFIDVCEEFEDVLDVFNALSEEELSQLAPLMGLSDGAEVWNQIFSDWANACTILELGAVYDAYYEDKNEETAAALVSEYERVFLTEGFFTEADRELFTVFFNDIEDVYTEAKAMLEDNGNGNTNTNTQPTDKPDTVSSSPETGDDFNAVPYAVAMVMAAAGAILAVKRRKA